MGDARTGRILAWTGLALWLAWLALAALITAATWALPAFAGDRWAPLIVLARFMVPPACVAAVPLFLYACVRVQRWAAGPGRASDRGHYGSSTGYV